MPLSDRVIGIEQRFCCLRIAESGTSLKSRQARSEVWHGRKDFTALIFAQLWIKPKLKKEQLKE
jgi:hypothetical protein